MSNLTTENDLCSCDHVREEHGVITGACYVSGCNCIGFEAAEDDEWDGDEDRE